MSGSPTHRDAFDPRADDPFGEQILPGMSLDAIDEFELREYFEQQRPPGKLRYRTGTVLSVR